jgi:hypothetical protein
VLLLHLASVRKWEEQGLNKEKKKKRNASVNFIRTKDNDLNFEKQIYFIGWVFIFLLMCFFFVFAKSHIFFISNMHLFIKI